MTKIVSTIVFAIFMTSCAFADVGGIGATCNPSTAGWPSCTRATILVKQNGYITNTVHISGGHLSAPMYLNTANTEYILDGNITADSTAFVIMKDYVALNLNGYQITYNQTAPGEGVTIGTWNLNDVAIYNGSIIQGAAMSEGDIYGRGNNPVSTYNTLAGGSVSVDNLQVANLYVRYGGRDVGGIVCAGDNGGLYEQNTVEDTYQFGTLKNRHQGVDALTGSKGINSINGVYRYNTLLNVRHRGIDTGNNATVYQNHISTRSIATNATGIGHYKGQNIVVYNNTIIARGEHPVGIGFGSEGTDNIEVYNNFIDSKVTALGEEYSSAYLANPSATILGNEALGFRATWGGNRINFHDNVVNVYSDSYYVGTYSPTGATAYIKSNARGIMMMLLAGETALFENNTITALDEDGTMMAKGVVVTGYDYAQGADNSGLVFKGNTITSNVMNVALGDSYGAAPGWPLFIQNTFVKSGSFANYATIGTDSGGYFTGTGKFVSNVYQNGAAKTSLDMHFGNHPTDTRAWHSVIFGRLMPATVKNSSNVVQPGVTLETHLQSGDTRSVYDEKSATTVTTPLNGQIPSAGNINNTEVITDANGQAYVIVYDYELHDVGSSSSTPLSVYYQPHGVEVGTMFTTAYDSQTTAWDYYTSTGDFTLTDANGSLEIDTEAPAVGDDETAPTTIPSPVGGTYSSTQTVSLVCTDANGCINTYYCTGSGCTPTIAYSTPLSISETTTLRYYSVDAVPNTETVKESVYTISVGGGDTTPPVISTTVPSGRYTSSQTVTLSANETATISYCTSKTGVCTPSTTYSAPFKVLRNIALHYYCYNGTDSANNTSSTECKTVRKQRVK